MGTSDCRARALRMTASYPESALRSGVATATGGGSRLVPRLGESGGVDCLMKEVLLFLDQRY